MPQGRLEWVTFLVGVTVSAVLLVLIVIQHPPHAAPAVRETATTTVSRPQATTATGPSGATTTPTTTARQSGNPAQPPVVIRFTARDDTWLSVRRTASAAPVYEGTLVAGASKTFSGTSFRIRFGGAANVRAVLNGKPLPLPGGTYSVTIGRSGLGDRSA